MSINDLVEDLYKNLLNDKDLSKGVSRDVREKIGVLYYTKELNSPYFFSFSFSIGVYLPFLSPVVFPLLISAFTYLKLKIKGSKPKVKSD
jgi:hypothetical protein